MAHIHGNPTYYKMETYTYSILTSSNRFGSTRAKVTITFENGKYHSHRYFSENPSDDDQPHFDPLVKLELEAEVFAIVTSMLSPQAADKQITGGVNLPSKKI